MTMSTLRLCVFLIVLCTLFKITKPEQIVHEVSKSEEKLDHNDIALKNKNSTSMTGRFLDILLKPLKKVWRIYVLRTLLPSVMGAKLIVLLPTLAIALVLLEGAIATAAFFYLLFTTAVAGKAAHEHYEIDPPLPWEHIDYFLDKHFETSSTTSEPPISNIISMLPTAVDSYTTAHEEAAWNQDGPYSYYNSNMSNEIAQEINEMSQVTAHSNPFAVYYAPHVAVTNPHYSHYSQATAGEINNNVYTV